MRRFGRVCCTGGIMPPWHHASIQLMWWHVGVDALLVLAAPHCCPAAPLLQAKGKGKKGERDTKPKDRAQKLLHTFETLNTFMKMGIEVPQTTAEVPKVGGAPAGRQEC